MQNIFIGEPVYQVNVDDKFFVYYYERDGRIFNYLGVDETENFIDGIYIAPNTKTKILSIRHNYKPIEFLNTHEYIEALNEHGLTDEEAVLCLKKFYYYLRSIEKENDCKEQIEKLCQNEFYNEFIIEIKPIGNFVAVDLETTGFSPKYAKITEIAAIKVVNWQIVQEFNTLVNPSGKKISKKIAELTGITNDMVKDAPEIESVLIDFLEFVGDNIIIAHNATFDINFIHASCIDNLNRPFTNHYICTMRLARNLTEGLQNHKLEALVKEFELGDKVEHRALADCKHVVNLYDHLCKHALSNNINLKKILATILQKKRLKSNEPDPSSLLE